LNPLGAQYAHDKKARMRVSPANRDLSCEPPYPASDAPYPSSRNCSVLLNILASFGVVTATAERLPVVTVHSQVRSYAYRNDVIHIGCSNDTMIITASFAQWIVLQPSYARALPISTVSSLNRLER
jgi:hypothetical protein